MEIRLIIRVMPSGDDIDISIPLTATANEIIKEIIKHNFAPEFDSQRNKINYKLVKLASNREFIGYETVEDEGLIEGDILFMIPNVIAGGGGTLSPRKGKLAYKIPNQILVGNKAKVYVRISRKGLKKYLLTNGLIEEKDIEEIEIGKLMKVSLVENAIKKGIEIFPLSTEKQLITKGNYTEWIYSIIPTRIGLTSMVLKISLIKSLKELGQSEKNVFVFEQEINVLAKKTNKFLTNVNDTEFDEINEITSWTKEKNELVIYHVSKNETGKAISIITNHFQHNSEFQNSIIILKSQYNHGKNLSNLNLIEQSNCWMIQSKINYSILQLISQLREEKSKEIVLHDHEEILKLIDELN